MLIAPCADAAAALNRMSRRAAEHAMDTTVTMMN